MFILDKLLRPPGACEEKKFLSQCVRCGKCIHACPYGSVRIKGGLSALRGTPYVDPLLAPCYLCLKCMPVCPTNALAKNISDIRQIKMGQAYILKNKCYNFAGGTMCSTCYDRCPLRGEAVIMEFGITPAMTKACAGCGLCAFICPARAIVVMPASSSIIPAMALPLAMVKNS